MKNIITKLSPRNGTLISALLIATLIIYSCRKSETSTQSLPSTVSVARSWYESTYPGALTSGNKTVNESSSSSHDLTHWIKPDWNHFSVYDRAGKHVIEMPIDPGAKFGSNLKLGNRSSNPAFSRSYYILLNDGLKYEAYILTIIADSAYLGGDKKKLELNTYRKIQPDFSGSALYFSPKGVYMGGYTYKYGKIVTGASDSSDMQGKTAVQSVNVVKPNNIVQECTDWYIAYFIDGVFQYAEYLGTTCESHDDGSTGGSGGGTPPPPPPCPPGSHPGPPVIKPCIPPAVESIGSGRLTVNYVPPPPPPGDGGVPPPSQTPCSVDGPAEPCPDPADPCSEKAKINTNANNATIKDQNAKLATYLTSSTLEHGFSQNLQSISGPSYLTTPVLTATAANPDEIVTTFKWNSTDGYTIGFTHDHPNGTGPSSADIFAMLINSQKQTLTSAGASAVQFYKDNASMTVVTAENNYVVTVKDWSALQTLYNQYAANPTAFDNNIINKNDQYNSYESALLDVFGSSINLYTNYGSTSYYPLTINSTTHATLEYPCPTN